MTRLERQQAERIQQLEMLLAENVWVTKDQLLRIVTTVQRGNKTCLLDRLRTQEHGEMTQKHQKRYLNKFLAGLSPYDSPIIYQATPPTDSDGGPTVHYVRWGLSERKVLFHLERTCCDAALRKVLERLG